jgi:hypothetical protein
MTTTVFTPTVSPSIAQTRMFSIDRISRDGNQHIERLRLDESRLESLRSERIGLLAGGFLGLESMLSRVLQMHARSDVGKVLVLYASKVGGGHIYDLLTKEGATPYAKRPPRVWELGCLTFSSVESAVKLPDAREASPVSMVVLLDSSCMVHHARTMQSWNGRTHDRPSILADALTHQSVEGVEPLLMVMTRKPPISIDTNQMARMYCREAWYFCDGPSMSFP